MFLFCRNIFHKPLLNPPLQRACYASLNLNRSFSLQAKIREGWYSANRAPHRSVRWFTVASGLGLGMATSFGTTIYCDPSTSPASRPALPETAKVESTTEKPSSPPPSGSIVNLYELSFGTVAGICAGVFIKKGAKVIAFFVGGVFVLFQYLNYLSFIRVDWNRVSKGFENLFHTIDANGVRNPPTVGSLWRWLVNFLTTDFQPRASFAAGLLLGLRLG